MATPIYLEDMKAPEDLLGPHKAFGFATTFLSRRRIMNRITTIWFVLIYIAIALIGTAKGDVFPKRNQRINEIKERLITLRNWKLMEEFNLTGARAQRVFSILSRFDKERERLLIKRRRLIKRLREAIDRAACDEELKRLMKELTSTNVELSRIPQRELEGLKKVFSTRELARYLLFSQRFAREARRLLKRERRNRPRPNVLRPQGPGRPGGPPQGGNNW